MPNKPVPNTTARVALRAAGADGRVTVEHVLSAMAEAMTPVNAGRWQVRAVARWRDMVQMEHDASAAAGEKTEVFIAAWAEPGRHAGWQTLARQVAAGMRDRAIIAADRSKGFGAAADRKYAETDALLAQPDLSLRDRARAAQLKTAARRLSDKAVACNVWATVADEAASFGFRLIRRADRVHLPVGRAIARAGRGWVPEDKTFLTRGN